KKSLVFYCLAGPFLLYHLAGPNHHQRLPRDFSSLPAIGEVSVGFVADFLSNPPLFLPFFPLFTLPLRPNKHLPPSLPFRVSLSLSLPFSLTHKRRQPRLFSVPEGGDESGDDRGGGGGPRAARRRRRRPGGQHRLRVQGRGDWRLGGGEDSAAGPIHQERVLLRLQIHNWGRVPDPHRQHKGQGHQGPDLGHRRPGKGSAGSDAGVRHHEAADVRPRGEVGGGAPCARRQLHRHHAHWQQGRPGRRPPRRHDGGRRRVRRGAGALLLRGLRIERGQRGQGLLPGAGAHLRRRVEEVAGFLRRSGQGQRRGAAGGKDRRDFGSGYGDQRAEEVVFLLFLLMIFFL
ncbi:unnamed protein product, partial [Linum tenue]